MERKRIILICFFIGILICVLILEGFISNKNINKYNNIAMDNENIKEIFLNVLDNKKKFVNEDNKEVSINEYIKKIAESERKMNISYTIVDMDGNGYNELIAKFEGYDIFYLALNYENNIVYGFEFKKNEIANLKTNGYYFKSESNTNGKLIKSKFSSNVRHDEILAQINGEIYKIQENVVDKDKFYEYLQEELYSKESVSWKKYKEITISEDNENFQEGTYVYDSPNGEQNEILIIKNNKIEWKTEYLKTTKTGTYSIKDNTLTAIYTKESVMNQSENETVTNQISRKIIYTLMEDGLYFQDNGQKQKYTRKD